MTAWIKTNDLEAIRQALAADASLANAEIPWDKGSSPVNAHVLHRICDAVFNKFITEEQALAMAKLFLAHGAKVNGNALVRLRDSPLVAAARTPCDQLGLLYLNQGADIHHAGCFGGTALHWASWCGRDVLVNRLIEEKANINMLCDQFGATPLFWAVHGHRFGGPVNQHHQVACVQLLLAAGADKTIASKEGYVPLQVLAEEDTVLRALLQ